MNDIPIEHEIEDTAYELYNELGKEKANAKARDIADHYLDCLISLKIYDSEKIEGGERVECFGMQ